MKSTAQSARKKPRIDKSSSMSKVKRRATDQLTHIKIDDDPGIKLFGHVINISPNRGTPSSAKSPNCLRFSGINPGEVENASSGLTDNPICATFYSSAHKLSKSSIDTPLRTGACQVVVEEEGEGEVENLNCTRSLDAIVGAALPREANSTEGGEEFGSCSGSNSCSDDDGTKKTEGHSPGNVDGVIQVSDAPSKGTKHSSSKHSNADKRSIRSCENVDSESPPRVLYEPVQKATTNPTPDRGRAVGQDRSSLSSRVGTFDGDLKEAESKPRISSFPMHSAKDHGDKGEERQCSLTAKRSTAEDKKSEEDRIGDKAKSTLEGEPEEEKKGLHKVKSDKNDGARKIDTEIDCNAPQEDTKLDSQSQIPLKKPENPVACPRCNSFDTKFCYYNNYNIRQPRHFCKQCQRYWTAGGTLRNVPVGSGRRKNKNAQTKSNDGSPVPSSKGSSGNIQMPQRSDLGSDAQGSMLERTKSSIDFDPRLVGRDDAGFSAEIASQVWPGTFPIPLATNLPLPSPIPCVDHDFKDSECQKLSQQCQVGDQGCGVGPKLNHFLKDHMSSTMHGSFPTLKIPPFLTVGPEDYNNGVKDLILSRPTLGVNTESNSIPEQYRNLMLQQQSHSSGHSFCNISTTFCSPVAQIPETPNSEKFPGWCQTGGMVSPSAVTPSPGITPWSAVPSAPPFWPNGMPPFGYFNGSWPYPYNMSWVSEDAPLTGSVPIPSAASTGSVQPAPVGPCFPLPLPMHQWPPMLMQSWAQWVGSWQMVPPWLSTPASSQCTKTAKAGDTSAGILGKHHLEEDSFSDRMHMPLLGGSLWVPKSTRVADLNGDSSVWKKIGCGPMGPNDDVAHESAKSAGSGSSSSLNLARSTSLTHSMSHG